MGSKTQQIAKGIGKVILATLAVGGVLVAGAMAPNIFVAIKKIIDLKDASWTDNRKKRDKKILDSFTYLRRKGLVRMEYRGKQLYISLTPQGRKLAKKYPIDSLSIKRQKKWDGTWHLILFDIKEKVRVKRDALRGKLKELGFYQVQKSVWLHAFPCEKELNLLRNFFGLSERLCVCFEVKQLPQEIEKDARSFFGT